MTTVDPMTIDAKTRTALMVLLLSQATTSQEKNAVTRAALRARFMWRCQPCKADNHLTATCSGCHARRPLGLA
ncbi:hypothetical protein OG216_19625 [Streptomycetaceae bacterium NBC_01309]